MIVDTDDFNFAGTTYLRLKATDQISGAVTPVEELTLVISDPCSLQVLTVEKLFDGFIMHYDLRDMFEREFQITKSLEEC